MNQKLSKARQTFIATAEKELARELTSREFDTIRGFAEAVVEIALKRFNPAEIVEMLKEVADDKRIRLLNNLSQTTDGLAAARRRLLDFLPPNARRIVDEIDLSREVDQFSGWFLDLLHSEPIPAQVRALNFGLFETDAGCGLYVVGAKNYNGENSDFQNDWCPDGGQAPFDRMAKVWDPLRNAGVEPWLVIQAITILIVKSFFEQHNGDLKKIWGLRRLYVTSGFDDGDSYSIRTEFTPKSRPTVH